MMGEKGFNARVLVRHDNYTIGEVVYMKAVEFRFSTPILFAILNRRTGQHLSYVDTNEFKNRFERIGE